MQFVILDVAIGLIFVFMLLSLVCTAANEWVATLLKLRARTLAEALRRMLDAPQVPLSNIAPQSERRLPAIGGRRNDAPLTAAFYAHPLIKSLSGKKGPSYIPPRVFAAAVADLLSRDDAARTEGHLAPGALQTSHEGLRASVDALQRTAAAGADVYATLERWFEDMMERASGWYKRKTQLITALVAAAITVAANADTLRIASTLWVNPTVRTLLVQEARTPLERRDLAARVASYPDEDNPFPETGSEPSIEVAADAPLSRAVDEDQRTLGQILGWSTDFKILNQRVCADKQLERDTLCADPGRDEACRKLIDQLSAETRCVDEGVKLVGTAAMPGLDLAGRPRALAGVLGQRLIGWLLTIIAISIGAPFWFDLLKKVMNVRSAGTPPKEVNP